MKIGSVAKSRNSDTFRRSITKSGFSIAIAPKLHVVQYGYCNFVGVLNTIDWPICALNIGQKTIFVFFVARGACLVETDRFPYGA